MLPSQDMIGGLKDLTGVSSSLKEIMSDLPPDDIEVSQLALDLKDISSRLLLLLAQTEKLKKDCKVKKIAKLSVAY